VNFWPQAGSGRLSQLARRALTGAVALGLGVSGYSAAAQLGPLPPAAAASAPSASAHPAQPRRVVIPKPKIQLGAGIDLYTYAKQDFAKSSVSEVAYLKALNANSVMASFPFFISGKASSTVFAKPSTPTPAELAVFAQTAASAGLYVVLRPLMDQSAIGESRASWAPHHPQAWFASYQSFLLPYATMAQQVGIPALYVGAEFSRFQKSPYWAPLDKALRKVFKGTLLYANNGPGLRAGTAGGAHQSVDAYPDIPVSNTATVARLTKAWKYLDKHLPHHNVLSEVGIAGVAGAFRKPWFHHWPNPKIDPTVQVRWFEAACQAAAAQHLGGIYFWAIGFGKDELETPLSATHQAAWEVGPGEQAIAACFKQVGQG
jgi:hypothetical protein